MTTEQKVWLDLVREDYLANGEPFALCEIPKAGIGYLIEPWGNDCFGGPPRAGRPEPVSLDWDDARVTRHEEMIRDWIAQTGHREAVAECLARLPAGWSLILEGYQPEWSECEFGASVVILRTG